MVKVLDMQFIRYANLFGRVTRIRTNHCFEYNNTIVFAVPRRFVGQAIGEDNKNLKRLNELIRKKIKIVPIPNGKEDIENFVSVIISPVKFKAIDVKGGEAVINATSQSKASLIGRNKVRLTEMQGILGQYFGIRKLRVR
jgi:transcription antitermination factor NusA-like protein|tara:strand:- start:720 stop:1139 length:420 start_codon:yes stop_codon:yes gene_type:complete